MENEKHRYEPFGEISPASLVLLLDSKLFSDPQEEELLLKVGPVRNPDFLMEAERKAGIGNWEVDWVSQEMRWSAVMKDIHEVDRDYKPTLNDLYLFYKEGTDREIFSGYIRHTVVSGNAFTGELTIKTARGNERRVRIAVTADVVDGQCSKIYGAIRQVHETDTIEEELIPSRIQLEALVQPLEGIVRDTDAHTHEIVFISDQVESILGYTPTACINETGFWQKHIHPEDREHTRQFGHFVTDALKNPSIEYRMIKADGNTVWVKDAITVIHHEGKPRWIRGLVMDITQRKRFEALEMLEKTVLEMASETNVTMQRVITLYVHGIEKLFPHLLLAVHQVKHDRLYNWAAPSLPGTYVNAIENLQIGNEVGSCGTAAFLKERVIVSDIANDPRWSRYKALALAHNLHACWSHPIIDSDGHVMATFAIYYREPRGPGLDELGVVEKSVAVLKVILENRRKTEILIDSTQLMAQGEELAHFGNWQLDISGSTLSWSNSLSSIYGLNPALVKPSLKKYISALHPDDRDTIFKTLRQVLKTHGDAEYEERIVRPTGEIRHLKSWCRIKLDEYGKPVRLIGACLDITESKKDQENLLATENRLANIINAQTNYVIRTDFDGNYTYCNNKFVEDFGWFYGIDHFIGFNCMLSILPYHRHKVVELVENCRRLPGVLHMAEIDSVQQNDGPKTILWHFICLTDPFGLPMEIQSIGIDVSDRKQAEKALKKSNELYKYVNKATNDAIYDYDIAADHMEWGGGFYRLFGHNRHGNKSALEGLVFNIHPFDRERVRSNLSQRWEDPAKNNWNLDFQFRKADGNYAYVEENSYIIRNRKGRVVRMIGVLRDVTRRKEEEHRLKLMESVVTHTNDLILISEPDPLNAVELRIVHANEAFTKVTGYTIEEIIGKNPATISGSFGGPEAFNPLIEAILNKKPAKIDTVLDKKDGKQVWISASVNPIFDDKGVPTHWISVGHDVTERMDYIRAIEKQNQVLQEIAWTQSHVVRAPLARLMGLINLLKNYPNTEKERQQLLEYVQTSANELDEIVRDISQKSGKL